MTKDFESKNTERGEVKAIHHEQAQGQREFDEVMKERNEAKELVTNRELEAAGHEIGSEKTTTAQRNRNAHAVVDNRTMQGMPSDAHQALIAVSQSFRDAAQTHEEVSALLKKYEADEDLSKDVRELLSEALNHLEPKAKVYKRAHVLLEKNV